ncbi:MAG: zinc ribbon domain-containing protein [Deltaproteobacteria bacterium]|nr:zinc ribbon domain-containing protein [Deltaproteobacteria bacterium]
MNCPSCKHPCTAERNYCGSCGSPLARYCSLCGFRNLAADRFCGGCGSPLGAEARPPAPPPMPGAAGGLPDSAGPAAIDSDLDELLAAAQEPAEARADEASVRVSQDDIDSLFGD